MVREEFPRVQLIRREVNCGISGWNDGFAVATGDLVLVLDDDCYLPGDGLRRAIEAMREHDADMVSFAVSALDDPEYRFDLAYKTGLLAFWGCAALIRREALEQTGGFDPEIFVWAHEVEYMLRFYDHGFRHLHLPEVTAVHMKASNSGAGLEYFGSPAYRYNARNFGYVVGKHLWPRDAFETLVALLALNIRHGLRIETANVTVARDTLSGFVSGMRHRDRLRNRSVSRTYRRNFYSFASPWWVMRPPREWLRGIPDAGPRPRRVEEYFEARRRYYPDSAASLRF
jgi:GT2 family glycosyltransferase